MTRARTVYRCTGCGAAGPKWMGWCTACDASGTLVEERAQPPGPGLGPGPGWPGGVGAVGGIGVGGGARRGPPPGGGGGGGGGKGAGLAEALARPGAGGGFLLFMPGRGTRPGG